MADSPSELHAEIEKLERKHAEHPEGRYFVPLANAYRKLGDVEYAESLLREGLRRHPDYLSAHIVLGRCLADRSATREAGDEFRYVLSFDPQNLIALRTLGELATIEGRPAEAERWYEELLAVDPMNDEARRALEALRGAAAVPEVEEEFRPDAAWWEREPAPEETEPQAETAPAQQPESAAPVQEPFVDEARESREATPAEVEPVEVEPAEEETDEGTADIFESAGTAGESDSEVVTETIAELYARQGFYERAAGVYRELIRRRGGDAALERRLADMEARMGGLEPAVPPPPPAPPSPEPEFEPEPETEPVLELAATQQDAFATSFEDGFFTGDAEGEAEPVAPEEPQEPAAPEQPEQREEPEEPAPTAPAAGAERETIASYLRALLAWTPGGASVVEAPAPAGATLAPEPEPVLTEPEPAPEEAVERGPEPESGPEAEPELEPEVEPQTEAAPVAEEPGTGRAEADLFPWELPMDTASGTAGPGVWEPSRTEPPRSQPPAAPEPLRVREEDDFFSFDAFFSDAPAEEQTPSGEARPGEEPAAPEKKQEPAPAAEEDDDLESFQAWLRSLKR